MKTKNYLIECPCCGAQYHPAEIFYPDQVFGKPTVVRDSSGKVVVVNGTPLNLTEKYTCDYCEKPFEAVMRVDFKASYKARTDCQSPYCSKQTAPRIALSEGD